ncbi:MAG: DUF2236 domain-containing protein [Cytophagales bacterium]|nr:MAG: DUF2236 domain-containing protein [Cytophagales bacterium]
MNKNLDDFRKLGDAPADDFVQFYFSDTNRKLILNENLLKLNKNKDWENFLIQIPKANWFDKEIEKSEKIDNKTMKLAIGFYQKKENYILQLLGLLSLPYCYAAADGAKVLFQTARMYSDVEKRLTETALFIKNLMDLKAFEPEGLGKIQLFKVRIMHAAARFYLQKSNWNLSLGIPVNQEDLAGTNLSFSLIVIRGLRKMGFSIKYEEQLAYINYWNYVGSMLGLESELLPKTGKDAIDLEKNIRLRHFKKSKEGIELTNSLLQCFYKLNDEKEIKNNEISGFMRYLLGNEVSNILEIPNGEFSATKQLLLKLKVAVY